MNALPAPLRRLLENAAQDARDVAEAGALAALNALAVPNAEPFVHLSESGKALRRALRAQARQLGDAIPKGAAAPSIAHLVEKVAYDTWHRLLFTRFLAENQLLQHPGGANVTLQDCEELIREDLMLGASNKGDAKTPPSPPSDGGEGRGEEARSSTAPLLDPLPARSSQGEEEDRVIQPKREFTAPDGRTLAVEFAARMLPAIFRADDPAGKVALPPEYRSALFKLIDDLPRDVFLADDSLGWCYQFWQARRKEAVNRSGRKIGANELPAVTQLFTEHYMVLFLLHNTIGAWYAGRKLTAENAKSAEIKSEEEARRFCAVPGVDWEYLRLICEETPALSALSAFSAVKKFWLPAAGMFPGWPKTLRELRLLDPCCGSGHFLVAAFILLVWLRMQDEGLSARDACDAVLRDNLHGLELDPRCTQIAAFNLALAAWKFPDLPAPVGDDVRSLTSSGSNPEGQRLVTSSPTRAIGFRPLPGLHIACSGLGVNARKEDWLALANGNDRLRQGMERLYDLFQKAPELGSLIDPRAVGDGDLVTAGFAELEPLLGKALQSEKAQTNDELNEMGVAAQGMARAAEILASQFHLVVTNVPYLARGKQGSVLQEFSEENAPMCKMDLATVFVWRCIGLANENGTVALITPQNWLFLTGYTELRSSLLHSMTWDCVARLGSGAFETITGEIVNTAMVILTCARPELRTNFCGLDVSSEITPLSKSLHLKDCVIKELSQNEQLGNPDHRIVLSELAHGIALRESATALSGCSAGDSPRFVRNYWEIPTRTNEWEFHQTTVSKLCAYGGKSEIIFWENERGVMYRLAESVKHLNHAAQNWLRGKPNWGKRGVVISQMGDLAPTIYLGDRYDCNCCAIVPNDDGILPALWAYCSAPDFNLEVRKLNQKLNVTPGTLLDVSFDLARWQKVVAEKYPDGLPQPFSSDPTQWLFNGHPKGADNPLQVAVARLLGYRWPRLTGSSFPDCPALEPDGLEPLADADGVRCTRCPQPLESPHDRNF